jgi:hypothetical protein
MWRDFINPGFASDFEIIARLILAVSSPRSHSHDDLSHKDLETGKGLPCSSSMIVMGEWECSSTLAHGYVRADPLGRIRIRADLCALPNRWPPEESEGDWKGTTISELSKVSR